MSPLFFRGYLKRHVRQDAMAYDPDNDAAVRIFETPHGSLITVEIGGQIEIFHDIDTHPDTWLEYIIGKLVAKGFTSNGYGKLFGGKFRTQDPVRGVEVAWESVYVKIERDARAEYDRDMLDPNIKKPLLPFEYYLDRNDWYPNGGYIPTKVTHLNTLEVRTSPIILNNTLELAMQEIQDYNQ